QGERSGDGRGYEGDVSRIGDYHGEPLKLIHWKLSARLGELKVRELSGPTREPVLIDPSQLPGPGLEERLSCASYLVNRLQREGCPVGLRLGDSILPPEFGRAHRLRLLSALGRHGFG
ncbi:MAG: DUF58 domain-containing protein, partial [Desulfuromonadales bacterium]|nr:DUF58 domain-containing protein [Desulfuromonadales bacterium]